MSAMKNLDLILQQNSPTPEEYDENKTLISMHLDGIIGANKLPQHLKDILFQWEQDELELDVKDTVAPWDNNFNE